MLAPEKVCDPVVSTILPLPLISPLKVPVALVMVRVLVPKTVVPLPAKLTTLAPEVVPLMSKLLSLVTPLELAILPAPDKAKVPVLIVVLPV